MFAPWGSFERLEKVRRARFSGLTGYGSLELAVVSGDEYPMENSGHQSQ